MSPDLFDLIPDPDAERLLAAGWTRVTYYGLPAWRSPDGKLTCEDARDALRELARLEGLARRGSDGGCWSGEAP